MILTDFLIIAISLLLLGLTAVMMLAAMGEKFKSERRSKIVFWSVLSVQFLGELVFLYSYFAT